MNVTGPVCSPQQCMHLELHSEQSYPKKNCFLDSMKSAKYENPGNEVEKWAFLIRFRDTALRLRHAYS